MTTTEATQAWQNNEDVICKGCENHIEESDDHVFYFDEIWHTCCANEDRRQEFEADREAMRHEGIIA